MQVHGKIVGLERLHLLPGDQSIGELAAYSVSIGNRREQAHTIFLGEPFKPRGNLRKR